MELELLAATVHSLIRRLQPATSAGSVPAASQQWSLDQQSWCLTSPEGRSVALTRSERPVVCCLFKHADALITRETLLSSLTDNIFDFDPHRLDSLIYRLRRKVAEGCGRPLPLTAVHGEGYLFDPSDNHDLV